MPFSFKHPDGWVPIDIHRVPRDDGQKVLLLYIEFQDSQGAKLKTSTMGITARVVKQWIDQSIIPDDPEHDPEANGGKSYAELRFEQVWDEVPEIPQATLDKIKAKLPDEAIQQAW
jgi:hypothetical protein